MRDLTLTERPIALVGVPWDGGSSFLRGPAEAPSRIRGALWSRASNLTADLDVLDPAHAPGVSHHEPGGLSTREVLELVKAIPGPLLGADVVELNPRRADAGITAAVAGKLTKEILAEMLEGESRR